MSDPRLPLCQFADDLHLKNGAKAAKRNFGTLSSGAADPAPLTIFRTEVALTPRFCHFLVKPA
jgi:hypothetical protein